ncbi:sensor histidine kinase [Desnuesiella massiliensis]|uniref:sensor histidine kinase n=1 Tax=Desnuesiella massiliensis TaxID=1650662 RepID=UPI0006E1410F|nr:HAMP domain-containing sensor histidine kinase [Desnuesiella massiliensis]
MFKKLKNKFLFLNLVIISVTMLLAFISIYAITYDNTRKSINLELHRLSKPNEGQRPPKASFDVPNTSRSFSNTEQPPEPSVSFTLIADSNKNLVNYFSIFQMEKDFYESAMKMAFSKDSNTGSFNLDGRHWAFIINPQMDLGGYRLVFLDVTSQQSILNRLVYTFLIVVLVMMIIIFFISRFFANKSIKPIKEAFDKQKQFIADASHELKTPLAVINTNADVLLSNSEDKISTQAKWIHYIKSEVDRMTKLTNDLLYLTQMDYSEIKMIFTDFNLSEAVENVILTMEAIIFENNISLTYDIEPNLMIHGNSEQIKQVVMILLDNALKYTNKNGTVNITLKKYHNSIILSLTNTGEGIPEDQINKIFDRFYRIDKSRARKTGGYGLGLAIAKAIVDQHGGKIYAKSILNESTTFSVELPRGN